MSHFSGLTPVVRLSIINRFTGDVFPGQGRVEAIVDTGYDGFVLVPEALYREVGLDAGRSTTREVLVADGRRVSMRSAVASVEIGGVAKPCHGFIETGPGVGEVLAGTRLVRMFRMTLDYCTGSCKIEPCG